MTDGYYRHKKRGTVYRILHEATLQLVAWDEIDEQTDMREMIVYQDISDKNKIWVRSKEEFFDGRFEEITHREAHGG